MLTTIALGTLASVVFFGGISTVYAWMKLGKKDAKEMAIYSVDLMGVICLIWLLLAIVF